MGAVLLRGEGLVEHLVYEARLARAGDAGDAGEDAQRYLDVYALEIVLPRVADGEELPVPLPPFGGHGDFPRAGEVLAREAPGLGHDVLRRTLGDDLAAVDARAGAYVHYPVGGAHGVLVVLDDYERVAEVAQLLERGDELPVVALVQADARLVEDVEHADERGAYLRGEPYALALAARERRRRAREGEVLQSHAREEVQPGAYLLEYHVRNHPLAHGELRGQLLYEGEGLRHGHIAEVHYREPAHGDGEGLLFETLPAAVGAGVFAEVLLVLLAHALALRVAVAALYAVHEALEGLAEHALAARGVVLQLQRLAVRAVHERVHGRAWQVLYRRRELETVLLRERVVVHLGYRVRLRVAPAGGLDAALEYAEVGVPDDEPRVGPQLRPEAGAGRAGAVGAVEGEHPRRELLYGYAAVLAGVVLRKELLRARGDVVHEHEPAGEGRRRLRAVR